MSETILEPPEPKPQPLTSVPAHIPARMLNEFTYCPRLAYLEWTQGEWKDNVETIEGKHVHRNVDRPEGSRVTLHTRSVHLTSETLGLTAVIDLIERDGKRVRPVDYKRGKRPPVAAGAWEPERVQLCAQGLLLREEGYECNEGLLYFNASRDRVRVRFTADLVARTMDLLRAMRATLANDRIPPPLEDNPKCPRCSLVSICLPEEVNFLRRGAEKVRPIAVVNDGTEPLIVQEPGSVVRLCGSRLRVMREGKEEGSVPLVRVSQLVLVGAAQASPSVFRECLRRGILIAHMSGTGWLHGITRGATHKNVELRIEQFAAARDAGRRVDVAREIVAAKIDNSRVMLRRNGSVDERDLEILKGFAAAAARSNDLEELLGIEGSAARIYYAGFASMLKARDGLGGFELDGRNRRPPKDRVNALLSFAYSLLTKDWVTTLETIGFDPMMGFYHTPKYGKPALALDLMEPFRPVVADSTVIGVINNGEIAPSDFYEVEGGMLLKTAARRRMLEAYERRMAIEVTHPLFGYRCAYRRLFMIEARLVARWLMGEIERYVPYRIR